MQQFRILIAKNHDIGNWGQIRIGSTTITAGECMFAKIQMACIHHEHLLKHWYGCGANEGAKKFLFANLRGSDSFIVEDMGILAQMGTAL